MQTKRISHVDVKDADKGEVSAVFSRFNVIDADGDVTLPGAFTDGAEVPISGYGHTSWTGALPVGKGRIRTTDEVAILDGQFFLNTSAGRDAFETVKQLGSLGQWSFGYEVLDADRGDWDGKQVRFLKRLEVPEVSPVLKGAGVRVTTLGTKSADVLPPPEKPRAKRAIGSHETEVTTRGWDKTAVESAIPKDARPSDLRSIYAWVDPDGDPEVKSSYKFPHHHGAGGPANVRALLAGIAALNGARGGASIPDADRKATYEHLASHLRDADREPPELRDRGTGPSKFSDELLDGLAMVSGLVDSASRVVALRASKGKSLSKVNTEFLDWIGDDLKRLQHLLTHPIEADDGPSDDEIASVVMAAVARVNDL